MSAMREIGDTLAGGESCRIIEDPLFAFPRYLYNHCGKDDLIVFVPADGKGYYNITKEEAVFLKKSSRKSSVNLLKQNTVA